MFRRAFSLLEVNLAILIMGTGVLSLTILFALGYRETAQSKEDVAASAYVDAVMSPLVMALADTNISWKAFNSIGCYPSSDGWAEYFDSSSAGSVAGNAMSLAEGAFRNTMVKIAVSGVTTTMPSPPSTIKGVGLVVMHAKNSPLVQVVCRASSEKRGLLTSPIYYEAVNFQGYLEKDDYPDSE